MVYSDGYFKPSLFRVFQQNLQHPEQYASVNFGGSAANSRGSTANFGVSKIPQMACLSDKYNCGLSKNTPKNRSDGLKKPSLQTTTLQYAVFQHIGSESDGLWLVFIF